LSILAVRLSFRGRVFRVKWETGQRGYNRGAKGRILGSSKSCTWVPLGSNFVNKGGSLVIRVSLSEKNREKIRIIKEVLGE